MASDSLLNVIQGLVKREDRIAKEASKSAKEKLKLEKEKDDEEEDEEEPAPVVGYSGDDSDEDEDEAPVGDQDAPETEPDPESEADPEGEEEPAPEPEAGAEPEAEPAPEVEPAPDPEAGAEPEDDGDNKPTGPDPALVDQVTNAVMAQVMDMLQSAADEHDAKQDQEIKLSGKKEKVNTKPKMEGRKPERRSFREAIYDSVTKGTSLAEGFESEILQILEDEGIDGPLGYEPFFEKGKLYVEKGSEKKAEKALKRSRNIRKVPKIVGEENMLEFPPMEAVEVDARFKGFKEAIKRLTYEKMQKIKEEEDKQKKYQAFVSVMLKKFGVESPAELEGDKKKAYFDALDKGWDAEGEKPEPEDKKSEKKNENYEGKLNEINAEDALALALTGAGIWALKKAWDKWGKENKITRFVKDIGKSDAEKDADELDRRKKADDAKADKDELDKRDYEKEFGDQETAQQDYDDDIKAVGPEKAKGMIAKGYSLDPEDDTKVLPSKEAKAKAAALKKRKQTARSRQGGLGKVDKDKQAALKKKLKDKRAGNNKEEFSVFAKEELIIFTEEVRSQLLEELVLEETMTLEESNELQAIMALDDVGIKAEINRKGQVVIKKKDKKKAQLAFEKSFKKGGWPPLKLEDSRSAYDIVSKARSRLRESSDANAERELYLFTNNERSLSRQKESIIKNIKQKMKSDRYDHSKAPKLWQYWVDNGAKQYVKEFGGNLNVVFPKDVRQSVAIQFANELQAEIKLELED